MTHEPSRLHRRQSKVLAYLRKCSVQGVSPSRADIAEHLGCKKQNVDESLLELRKAGIVTWRNECPRTVTLCHPVEEHRFAEAIWCVLRKRHLTPLGIARATRLPKPLIASVLEAFDQWKEHDANLPNNRRG